MDIVATYERVGSYRATAALCGTTHKTVRRVVEAARAGEPPDRRRRPARPAVTVGVEDLIAQRVRATDGRITAKRLLPEVRAAGYAGSARSLRRAVAAAKKQWRAQRRVFRPWVPVPGEHLVFDWTTEGGWQVFCAVLAWSRWRFVRVARDQKAATTMRLLAECFELLEGTPKVLLTDRMGCLKGGVVANVMVPTPEFVRFATHYGFRPDFCEAADPESKGMVEACCGYAQTDFIVPAAPRADLEEANTAARAWCAEVNGRVHTTTMAVPDERLVAERRLLRPLPGLRPPLRAGERRRVDKMSTVRFASARYSVPRNLVGTDVMVIAGDGRVSIEDRAGDVVATHRLVAPGECSLIDDHYGGVADNSVARQIDTLLRADLVIIDELGFAPLDLTGTQLLFRFVAAAYERRSLGIASHWPFDAWGRFLPEHTTAASLLDRLLHHAVVIVTEGDSYRMREARTRGGRPIKP